MCRLMYLPPQVRPPEDVLCRWMIRLSASNGGHGIGYATRRNGIVKSLGMLEQECAEALCNGLHDQGTVWHTRRRSHGGRVDALCHPFETGRRTYLVHNGTWHQGVFTAKCLRGDWSDTAVAALFIKIYGWKEFTEECGTGVWLRLTKKGVQVHYPSGQLHVETGTGALASEPCGEWGRWKPVAFGTYQVGQQVQIRHEVASSHRNSTHAERWPLSGWLDEALATQSD